MASRVSLIQSRSIYVGTLNSVAPSDGNLIVTGNVGIGTTSPLTRLTLSSAGDNFIYQTFDRSTGGANARYWQQGIDITHGFNWGRATDAGVFTSYMKIDSTGNVGIGTTNPTYKLQVAGTSYFSAEQTIQYTDAISTINGSAGWGLFRIYGGSNSVELQMDASSTTTGAATIGTYSNSDLYIKTNNTNKVVVKANGNVGINSTNPGAKLEVISANLGGTAGDQTLQALFSTNNGNGSYLEVKDVRTATGADWTFAGKRIQMRIDSTYMGYIQFNGNSNNYGISFGTGGTTSAPGDVSQRMVINSGGEVFINNNAASGASSTNFRVYAYDSDSYFRLGNNTSNSLDIQLTRSDAATMFSVNGHTGVAFFAGNVGINTTNPTERLDVAGNGKLQGNLYLTATDPYIEGSGSGAMRIKHTAGQSMYIRPDQSGAVVFFEGASGQAVYLNTASPSVNSTQNSSSTLTFEARARNAGGTLNIRSTSLQNTVYDIPNNLSRFSITGQDVLHLDGNVGIGTTTPGVRLDVVSSATAVARIYSTNTAQTISIGSSNQTQYTDIILPTDDGQGEIFRSGSGYSSYGGVRALNIWNSNGPIAFHPNNTGNVMYLSTTGNVGIGTTSPSQKLHVNGNIIIPQNNYLYFDNTAHYIRRGSSNVEISGFNGISLITSGSTRVVVTETGNVGIGTTAPDTPLGSARGIVINSGAGNDAQVRLQNNGTGTAATDGGLLSISALQMYLWNYESSNLIFGTANAERMRINSSGNIGIGTTSISYRVDISGDARILSGSLGVGVAPNATDGRIDASNDIVAYSTSDQRLKENVTPIENALEKVKTLTGVEFDWKEETAHVHGYHGHDVGIIAQDVQAVLPEAVRTNDSGYLSVRYEKMIALLIEANKELAARVEELEKKLK